MRYAAFELGREFGETTELASSLELRRHQTLRTKSGDYENQKIPDFLHKVRYILDKPLYEPPKLFLSFIVPRCCFIVINTLLCHRRGEMPLPQP